MDGLPTEIRWMIFRFLGERNLKVWSIMVRVSKTWRGDVMGWIRFRHGGNPVSLIENCIKGGDVTLLKLVMKMPECKAAEEEDLIEHNFLIEELVTHKKHPMMVLFVLENFCGDGGYFRSDMLSLAAVVGNYKLFASLYDHTMKDACLPETAVSGGGNFKIMRIIIHDKRNWSDQQIIDMHDESTIEYDRLFIREEAKKVGRKWIRLY